MQFQGEMGDLSPFFYAIIPTQTVVRLFSSMILQKIRIFNATVGF